MSLSIDLTGRTALVTGASGQLGRVIARTLAAAGADVAVHYHSNRAKADEVCADVAALGRRTCAVAADVADRGQVMAMRDAVRAALGDPAIVVANAVHQYAWKPVLEQDLEDFASQHRTCVAHLVLLAQAFAPAMIARRHGRIIAINTECAIQCTPNQGAYAAGKRGMDAVVRVLAREIGEHQVTVNEVAPGWMISDKYRGTPEERQPAYEKNIPLRRRGYDQDIANAVTWLASDFANFITGCYLPVSGGNVMPGI